jgi:hypothetical protein
VGANCLSSRILTTTLTARVPPLEDRKIVDQKAIISLFQDLRRISAHNDAQFLPRHTDELATYKIKKSIILDES